MLHSQHKWLSWILSVAIIFLTFTAIPATSYAVSSTLYGFSVDDGGGTLSMRWQNSNLGNTWAEGEWVPYQFVISGIQTEYGSLANMPEIVIKYQFYSKTPNDNRFVDLVKGFQVKATNTILSSTEVGSFMLQNSNQGWPHILPSNPIGPTDYVQLEVAQNYDSNLSSELWLGFSFMSVDTHLINLGTPGNYSDTEKRYLDWAPLQPRNQSDPNAYLRITDEDLIAAGVPADADTIVIYFQLHLSRSSLWESGLYQNYAKPSNPAYDWGGWVYGGSQFDSGGTPIKQKGSSYSPGSSGDARLDLSGQSGEKTVSIPVPAQPLAAISGYKWEDLNGNNQRDTGEGIAGWPIYVSAEIDGMAYVLKTLTNADGLYSFNNLTYGWRYIAENEQLPGDTGWFEISPNNETADRFNVNNAFSSALGSFSSYEAYLRDNDMTNDPTLQLAQYGYKLQLVPPTKNQLSGKDTSSYIRTGISFENSKSRPGIAINKLTNGSDGSVIQSGSPVTWTYSVTNTGNVPLANVWVDDDLLAANPVRVSGDTNGNNLLDLTETWLYQAEGIAIAGAYANTGIAHGTPPVGNPVQASDPSNYFGVAPALSIDKTAAEVSFDAVGDVIHYTITVDNTGNVPLTGVTVTDALLADEHYISGDINANNKLDVDETWTFAGTYTVTQTDLDAGKVDNTATADSNETEPASDSESVPAAQSPSLNIMKSAAESSFDAVGDVIHYTITVDNTGNVTLTGVTVTDALLADEHYVSGDINANSKLDVDETWTYAGTYPVTQTDLDAGQVDNTATADSNETGPDSDSESVPAIQSPSLNIMKSAAESSFDAVGDVIHYTITVDNTGNVTLTGVTVTDALLADEHYISGDINANSKLDVNETWTYAGTYPVTQDDLDAGQVDNTATADSSETGPDSDSESVPAIQSPMIDLLKTGTYIDENEDHIFNVGDKITYAFTIQNTGNVTLTNVMVTDPLIFVVGNPIAFLAPGAVDTITLTGVYWLTQPDIDAGTFTNTATVDGTPPTGPAVTDEDDDTQTFTLNPALELVKTGTWLDGNGDGFADAGETITYTFTVKNIGNVTLHDVSVTDTVGGVTVTGGPTTLDVGETDATTFTGTYTITQGDVDAGLFFNTATADSNESSESTDDETVDLPQNPQILIVKSGSFDAGQNGFVDAGETITYVFTVTNEGNITLTEISVTDIKVSNIVYMGGDGNNDNKLQLNETWYFQGTYQVMQADIEAGFVYNLATADAKESDEDVGDEDVILPQNPSIHIAKTVANLTQGGTQAELAELEENETAQFRIVVTNDGNMNLLNVVLTDSEAAPGTVAMIDGDGTRTFAIVSGQLPEISLGSLAVGQSIMIHYNYLTLHGDIARGPIENTAVSSGTTAATEAYPNGQPASDEDTAIIEVAAIPLAVSSINITKQVFNQTAGGTLADLATGFAGDTFAYVVTIANTGDTLLSNVVLTDDRAAVGSKLVRNSDNAELTWVADGTGKASLAIGELQAGASISFTYRYTAVATDEGEVIENTAIVKSVFIPTVPGYEQVPLEDEASATITIHEIPPQTGEGDNRIQLGLGLLLLTLAAGILFYRRRSRKLQK